MTPPYEMGCTLNYNLQQRTGMEVPYEFGCTIS